MGYVMTSIMACGMEWIIMLNFNDYPFDVW